NDDEKIRDTEVRTTTQERSERQQTLAEECEPGPQSRRRRDRAGSDSGQPWRPRVAAPGLPFRNGLREGNQALDAVGESSAVGVDAQVCRLTEHREHERDQSRIPRGDLTGIERDVADRS